MFENKMEICMEAEIGKKLWTNISYIKWKKKMSRDSALELFKRNQT